MVEDGAFSCEIDNIKIFKKIFNLKRHPNCTTGSIITTILLNGIILPIDGASAVATPSRLSITSVLKICQTNNLYLLSFQREWGEAILKLPIIAIFSLF